jgi:hypothetical protein
MFFEFKPSCVSECTREISLDSAGKSFTLIVTNIKTSEAGVSVPYVAENGFKVTNNDAKFVSLNKDNILRDVGSDTLWNENNLLYLYSDRFHEEEGPCGNNPYQESFVGFVTNEGESKLQELNLSDVYMSQFTSEDHFLEDHEQVFGLSNNLLIMPIKVIKYFVKPSETRPGYFDLFRSEFRLLSGKTGYTAPKRVALGIKRITFKRIDVTMPSISVLIKNN